MNVKEERDIKNNMYLQGIAHETRKEFYLAFCCFAEASKEGNQAAQYKLGYYYAQGYGIEPDISKAVSWYMKAAEMLHPEALINLSWYYAQGVVVEQSYERAYDCLQNAISAFKQSLN